MRPLRALAFYIAVVFLGGALLAPWLYKLAQAGATTLPQIADAPFPRFLNRCLQFLALAGLWPLLRGLGARKITDLGLVKPSGHWRELLGGFLMGFVSLAVLAALAVLAGARTLQGNLVFTKIASTLLSALLTAGIVAVLEEVLFRGGIFGGLRRVLDWRWALGVSSAVYALVHFLARASVPGPVTWNSGFRQLGLMLAGFTDWQMLIPGFFNLTLAGVLLALAYQRTGNLYFSMGLHGGWIFWLKSYRAVTRQSPDTNLWLWGSSKMIDGWLALVVLTVTLGVFVWMRRASKPVASA